MLLEFGAAALVIVLAASVVAPALFGFRGSERRVVVTVAVAATATCALLVGAAVANRHPAEPPEDPSVPLQVVDDDYRSSRSCRSCHPRQYATWHRSYHRTMTQTATRESVIGDFDDVRLRFDAKSYRMFEREGEFFAEMDAPGNRASTNRNRVVVPIKQTTGSHHMQIYWYPLGRSRMLGAFPLVYLREAQRWVPRRAAFITPSSAEPLTFGLWNRVCIECHSTHARPRMRESGQDLDSHVTELGIACEACHGPGGGHLAANRSPVRRYQSYFSSDPDPTIVDPSDLSHERSSQVCGQCHAVKTLFSEAQTADWMENGSSFRPGDDLEETANLIWNGNLARPSIQGLLQQHPGLLRSLFWPDGEVRVAGREYSALLETPCYQRGEMSCLSCHTLHASRDDPRDLDEWANDQLRPGMDTDLACTQCHTQFDAEGAVAKHTHHAPESSGSRCQNCHMPYTTYGLLKAIRSHQVDSPDLGNELEYGRPNACNQCHLDRSLGWTAEALARWYGTSPPNLTADQQQIGAGVRWALEGDAGVRALAAWSMSWAPAQRTAGTSWMLPYLTRLMDDPYDAVRIIAFRSLRTLPGFENSEFAELDPPARRAAAIAVIEQPWA
jgi:hypothetical protein